MNEDGQLHKRFVPSEYGRLIEWGWLENRPFLRTAHATFKARVALEALKGARTAAELATAYGVHPYHQWKKALLDGAVDIFERGSKKAAEIDESAVRALHAKIGELAVANDFLSRKLKP